MSPARYPLRHVAVEAFDATNVIMDLEIGSFHHSRGVCRTPAQFSQATISTMPLSTTSVVSVYIPDISSQWCVPIASPANLGVRCSPCYFCIQASSELAATYAALILADEGIEITVRPAPPAPRIPGRKNNPRFQRTLILNLQADKILALTQAAQVELEPIWAALLTKALEGKNVKELLSNVGAGGGGPAQAVGGGGGATGGAPTDAAEKEEEKKEEEKEESDDDMVCSLLFAYFCLTNYLFRASVSSINLLEPHSCTPFRVQMYLYSPRTLSVICNHHPDHS